MERQWTAFDPNVDPLKIVSSDDGSIHVSVHQRVSDLAGAILFNGPVDHHFRIEDGLITRFDVGHDWG